MGRSSAHGFTSGSPYSALPLQELINFSMPHSRTASRRRRAPKVLISLSLAGIFWIYLR